MPQSLRGSLRGGVRRVVRPGAVQRKPHNVELMFVVEFVTQRVRDVIARGRDDVCQRTDLARFVTPSAEWSDLSHDSLVGSRRLFLRAALFEHACDVNFTRLQDADLSQL